MAHLLSQWNLTRLIQQHLNLTTRQIQTLGLGAISLLHYKITNYKITNLHCLSYKLHSV